MDIAVSMIAFVALVVSWFVLPAHPTAVKSPVAASDAHPIAA